MNGLKAVLNALINGVSAVWFIVKRDVDWRYASIMMVAAIIGGYAGADVSRKLDKNMVRRRLVVTIGFALAGWEFYRQMRGALSTRLARLKTITRRHACGSTRRDARYAPCQSACAAPVSRRQ